MPYATLLQLSFPDPADAGRYLSPAVRQAYATFAAAAPAEQPFRFEQLRLGVALCLLKLLADLGDHDESRQLLPVLHRALTESRSPADIDRIMSKEARLFDQLYNNLYVNEEGELLLDLFARTLDADHPQLLDEVIEEAVDLVPQLDFEHPEDDED